MTTKEALEYIEEKTGIGFGMDSIRRWINPLRGYGFGRKDRRILLQAEKRNRRWFIKKEWVDEFLKEAGIDVRD
jgi:hypothetical protein